MKILCVMALLASLIACKEQNPLTDYPESVQSAVPLSQEIERPPDTPVPLDPLVLQGPTLVNFTEGVEGSFKLSTGQAVCDSERCEIRPVNPPLGMVFDKKSGRVSWTPPPSMVSGDDYYSKYLLNVDLIVDGGREILSTRKEIMLVVNVDSPPLSPHLLSIRSNPKAIKLTEGKEGSFTITGHLFSEVDAPYQINILSTLEGAKINQIEGGVEVSWTPPPQMVKGLRGTLTFPLEVEMVAGEEGEVFLKRTIPMGVQAASVPLAPHLLNIESEPKVINLREGEEGSFTLRGELLEGVKVPYKINILSPLEGAKIDQIDGGVKVSWTPSNATVKGLSSAISLPLEVEMVAGEKGEVSIRETIYLGVQVASTPLAPHLLDIVSEPRVVKLQEGQEGTFTIVGQLRGGVKEPYQINILSTLEGAKIRRVEGGVEVSWIPPDTIIKGMNSTASFPLEVEMVAGEKGEVSIRETIYLGVQVASTPLAPHLLDIVSEPKVIKLREGEAGSFALEGKLLEGVKTPYKINVLTLPKGAKVDQIKGGGVRVSWTPSDAIIKGLNSVATLPLEVEMVAGEKGEVSIKRTIYLGVEVASTPLAPHLLDIVSEPKVIKLREGEEGSFTLEGKLLEGARAPYKINVLTTLNGAKVDQIKGGGVKVSWTPSNATVKGLNRMATLPLDVEMVAGKEGEVSIKRTIHLGVEVASTPLAPHLLDIVSEPKVIKLREGNEGSFTLRGELLEGVKVPYKINVLSPLKGARIDRVDGEVKVSWTPSDATVKGLDSATSLPLEVEMVAGERGEEVSIRKTIHLGVEIASTPLASHLLDIVSEPKVIKLREGEAGSFTLEGKLLEGVQAPYRINVLTPLKGASVDPIEGGGVRVNWAPSDATVKGLDSVTTLPLEVEMVAGERGEVSIRKTIHLGVEIASTPLASHLLDIVSEPRVIKLREGEEGSFTLEGKLLEGVQAPYKINVLTPLKGARVDPTEGGGVRVSWTPSDATVKGLDSATSLPLGVEMVAGKEGEVSIKRTIYLGVEIASTPLAAHLLDIVSEPKVIKLREGEEGSFTLEGKLLEGVKAPYQINVLSTLAGAKIRRVKGRVEVAWTPPDHTITGLDSVTSLPLKVEMVAGEKGEVSIKRTIHVGVEVVSTPLAEHLLDIVSEPKVIKLREGEEGEFTLTGQLLEGVKVPYKVNVLTPLEGANIEQVEGEGVKVSWNPPDTTVRGLDSVTSLPLEIEMVCRGKGRSLH